MDYPQAAGGSGPIAAGTVITSNRTIYVYATNTSNCVAENSFSIIINAKPAAPALDIIQPTCAVTTGTISITAPTGAGFSYSIDGINYTNTNGIFSNVSSGNYNVTVKNSSGCISAATPATINAALLLPRLVVNDPAGVCSGSNVDITVPAITAGSDAGLNYTYWMDAAASIPLNNPNAVTTSGTYYIKAVNQAGCSTIAPVKVVVNQPPTVVFKESGSICAGSNINLNVTLTGTAPFKFTYTDGTNLFTTGLIPTSNYQFNVSPAINTTYTINNLTDAYCSSTGNLSAAVITVVQPVQPVRYPTVISPVATDTVLTARNLGIGYTYNWIPPIGLSSNSIINPVFNYDKPVEYIIQITSPEGCLVIDTILVKVTTLAGPPVGTADIFVPKAWSPNGDGHNDKLFAYPLNIRELKYFKVFNRWGQLVFETNSFNQGWDGIFNGKPQVMDVYTWIAEGISFGGQTIKRSGNSLLLR